MVSELIRVFAHSACQLRPSPSASSVQYLKPHSTPADDIGGRVMRLRRCAGGNPSVVTGILLSPLVLFVLFLATAGAQTNPIVIENQQPGATGWDPDVDHVGTDAVGQIK